MPRRSPRGSTGRSRSRRGATVVSTVAVLALSSCASGVDDGATSQPDAGGSAVGSGVSAEPISARRGPRINVGAGFLSFPDAASAWVRDNRSDPRAAAIEQAMVGQPTGLWLTGDESFGNLSEAVRTARAADRTMVLALYNIPLRWDGLSDPTTNSLRSYKRWIDRVTGTIGRTRAVVVLEPDALWFYDRLSNDRDRAVRMKAMRYAVNSFHKRATRTRLYLEAGTSSGSVTPERMAALLMQAGMAKAAGYAVNVSSYSPAPQIRSYAGAIRTALRARGVANPRYVTDTGRNGSPDWDFTWCNPASQRLGRAPRVIGSADGRDMDLWIKAPGTSDGDCGPAGGGQGTYGGEFIPELAYTMIVD